MLLYDIYILHVSMRQSNLNELTHINVQNRDMNWNNHLDIFFAQKKKAKQTKILNTKSLCAAFVEQWK